MKPNSGRNNTPKNKRPASSLSSHHQPTRLIADQSELERKFNQYLTHSEQQNQHLGDLGVGNSLLNDEHIDDLNMNNSEIDQHVWLNHKKAGVGSSRSRQQQHQFGYVENETTIAGNGRNRGSASMMNGPNSRSKATAIERIMMEEKRLQQIRDKERLISSSRNTGDETSLSTNASSRYIRNNSYLNANPSLNLISNGGLVLDAFFVY